jgi:hypothetical protein
MVTPARGSRAEEKSWIGPFALLNGNRQSFFSPWSVFTGATGIPKPCNHLLKF